MSLLLTSAPPLLGLGFMVFSYRRKKNFLETPIALRVRDSQRYGERLSTLTLESEDGAALPEWTPGSHIVVNVDAPQGTYRRAYSLLGGDTKTWKIAVAAHPKGKVSLPLANSPHSDTVVYAQPPRGRFFKLEQSAMNRVCLIGAGVGVAPLIPMAKQALEQGQQVMLIHTARQAAELIESQALQDLAAHNPKFEYLTVVTRYRQACGTSKTGRIDSHWLRQIGLAHYAGDIYLCGSESFVTEMNTLMHQIGCQGRIIQESFAGNTQHIPFQITVGDKQFTQGHAPTLLAACEENGVLPFAECRTGHCLNCRATLKSGCVTPLSEPKNTPQIPANQILLCACVPASNIELDVSPS